MSHPTFGKPGHKYRLATAKSTRTTSSPHRIVLMDSATVSLAYRLLGSAADAVDTVQDAFLRWQATDREYVGARGMAD